MVLIFSKSILLDEVFQTWCSAVLVEYSDLLTEIIQFLNGYKIIFHLAITYIGFALKIKEMGLFF